MRLAFPYYPVFAALACAFALVGVSGCAMLHKEERPVLNNPIAIPASRCDFVWDQIVDVVDRHRPVARISGKRMLPACGAFP